MIVPKKAVIGAVLAVAGALLLLLAILGFAVAGSKLFMTMGVLMVLGAIAVFIGCAVLYKYIIK